jgi:hypothetical protein
MRSAYGYTLDARLARGSLSTLRFAAIKSDWIGLDWIGLDWIGLDWIGLDWIGLCNVRTARAITNAIVIGIIPCKLHCVEPHQHTVDCVVASCAS